MAGNVSEWVLDVYRPLNSMENTDLRPYRGNVFKTEERDAEGFIAQKDSLGHLKYRDVTTVEAMNPEELPVLPIISITSTATMHHSSMPTGGKTLRKTPLRDKHDV